MSDSDENINDESMSGMADKLRETFKEEAYELIAELEAALLELEKVPGDEELIGRVFRCLHTIKGSGAACEMRDISTFAHEIESFFDQVRKRKTLVTKKIIDLTLSVRDQIKSMLDRYYKGGAVDALRTQEIVASFKSIPSVSAFLGPSSLPSGRSGSQDSVGPGPEDAAKNVTYRIRFRQTSHSIGQVLDHVELISKFRQLGNCRIVAQTEAGAFEKNVAESESGPSWDAILTTSRGLKAIQDIFVVAKDHGELTIEVIDSEGNYDDEASYKRLGEILVERGDLTHEDLFEVLRTQKKVGEMLVETGTICEDKVHSALVEQQHVRDLRAMRHDSETTSSVRVSTDRLDRLVNLVGELVTVQARLRQSALSHGITEFIFIAEEVERLIAELRDNTMNIRMLPIGTTFSKFKRLVRDLSGELGKVVQLSTDGAETELDKTIIERLSNPLVHLIRNSIDHGIEPPDVREAAGKPKVGTIHLSASHSGAHVLIRIRDDGAGLDGVAIRKKAVEKGMIGPDAELSDSELFAFVLTPDFSTARTVTNVSGRGVGLDVVKKAIDALCGSIEIASQRGIGTTITLKLPLTLAIIDGLLARIGEEHFIFPLSAIEECIELAGRDKADSHGRNISHVRGQIIPYIRLREQFMIHSDEPVIEQIVVVSVEGQRTGFVVDRVIGEHQTVIKNLGRIYKDIVGISGAAILGDGTVALVLDVPKLVQLVEREEARLARGSGLPVYSGHQEAERLKDSAAGK